MGTAKQVLVTPSVHNFAHALNGENERGELESIFHAVQNRMEGAKSVDDTDVDGGWAGRQRDRGRDKEEEWMGC